MKRLLRDKANYGVLEGFLTSLLGREIKILRLLESESNMEACDLPARLKKRFRVEGIFRRQRD